MQTSSTNLHEASAQWANRPADERFETLASLRDAVHNRRLRCRSVDVDRADVEVQAVSEKGLVINSEIEPCTPSHWAFGQLCQASKINGVSAPASYLRQLPAELAAKCLNQGLQTGEREAHKFMTIAPPLQPGGVHGSGEREGPGILQAVTSTTYGRIWDADVVDSVQKVVERSGGKFYNPPAYARDGSGQQKPSGLYASDRDVFMFMIDGGSRLEVGPRAELNRGFLCWNSETGARIFGLMTFVFNSVCGNHIIWGARGITKLLIRHTSGGPDRFVAEAAPKLRAYIEASPQPLIDTVKAAQSFMLPDAPTQEDSAGHFCATHGNLAAFTRSEITEAVRFAKSEEGDCRTLWHLVQGFTAYARGFDWVDSRVDLEKRAGSLLDLVARN